MQAEEYRALGERLESSLNLRYAPIALKLIYREDEIPEGSLRPMRDRGSHMAMCQAYAAVRRNRESITMLKEDHWCVWPLVSFGLVELSDEDIVYMGSTFFYKDPQDGVRHLRDEYPRLEKERLGAKSAPIGFTLAPIERVEFEPDIITVYCKPAQIRSIHMAMNFTEAQMLLLLLNPVDSCVHSSIPVLNGKDFNITFPDPGEYERAMADEDEVMFTMRAGKLQTIVETLDFLDGVGFGYKGLRMDMPFDFPRPEFYNTMFEKWGLQTGALWGEQQGKGPVVSESGSGNAAEGE